MPGIQYGTHRSIACIILHNHKLLMSDEVIGDFDGSPLTAGKLVELYNAKRLVVCNTTVQQGKPKPWFTALKVTRMLGKFELEKMFSPLHDHGMGIFLDSKKGTKHLLQNTLELEFNSTLTADSYIKGITRSQLNRIS